ncbi:hypothetical protein H0266_11865 [Halobacillus locisalis]|uniref:Uncharacterized protein n=1 Tax=Halobacillus locisalis TaxID=220753 RepID=A0A838CUL0_9BACI|nr:hypothetical protein [Halobacillus locisalis]MBA2175588.1 hypothetical protein [Halobacillus locisalis]
MIKWILSKFAKKETAPRSRTTIHSLPPKNANNKSTQEEGYVKDCDLGWC